LNEFLQVFMAFGTMLGGAPATAAPEKLKPKYSLESRAPSDATSTAKKKDSEDATVSE
jgi:hypothetical protein